jgi:hypothetical protein
VRSPGLSTGFLDPVHILRLIHARNQPVPLAKETQRSKRERGAGEDSLLLLVLSRRRRAGVGWGLGLL